MTCDFTWAMLGDSAPLSVASKWYFDRLVQLVTQEPKPDMIQIESPCHDGVHCHCPVGRGVALRRWRKDRELFEIPLPCMLSPKTNGIVLGSGRSTSSIPAEMLRIQALEHPRR
ncbi:MAG TPA: hypothetical protein PLF81_10870 [Candidatus Anammoximicrobium sp.]|nr:hypothetical protein [Candidatus Anammoximicrobium sp.]